MRISDWSSDVCSSDLINGYLGRTRGGKISFTHIIGIAVVRAIHDTVPVMNASYATDVDGKPRVIRHEHMGMGIAVDIEKYDGSRSLLVPALRDADSRSEEGSAGNECISQVSSRWSPYPYKPNKLKIRSYR